MGALQNASLHFETPAGCVLFERPDALAHHLDTRYSITPQEMRSPEFPDGWVW